MEGFPEYKAPQPPKPLPTDWEQYANGKILIPTYKRIIPNTRVDQRLVIESEPVAVRTGLDLGPVGNILIAVVGLISLVVYILLIAKN